MSSLTDIRSLYVPIQPTVKQSAEHVKYVELLPDTALQPYIYCYWELKTDQVLEEPFQYRVVADGCIDVFFELNNPENNWVMGFCKKYTEFPLDASFHYIGIRFLPTMFPQFFKVAASELSNRFESLGLVVPDLAQFIAQRFSTELDAVAISSLFDAYFLKLLSTTAFDTDKRLYGAIRVILDTHGTLNLQTDLNTGIGQRQLRRMFGYYIGDSAKTFSQVVRFQNILRAKPSKQSLRENKLFYDVGYYDQSHFIKAFKTFYGATPTAAFGRE